MATFKVNDVVRVINDISQVHSLQDGHGGWSDDMALVSSICMYVCMYVYVCVCMCVLYVCMYVCMYVYVYVCVYVCTCVQRRSSE